jgi:uncharacterized protein YabN with tetrapyrrole methylase and pyrophosphatase domain
MVIIVLATKFKMDNILKKTHYSIIPLFHYSMIESDVELAKMEIMLEDSQVSSNQN